MTIALVRSRSRSLPWGMRRPGMLAEPSEVQAGRSAKLVAGTVLAFGVLLPLLTLYQALVLLPGGVRLIPVAAATVCYLPVVAFWLVRAAVWGTRPRAAWWVLAGLAAGFAVLLPVAGIGWLGMLYPLAGLTLIIIRWPWSLLAFAACAAAPVPLAFVLGHPELAAFYTVNVVLTGALIAVPVWLAGAIRHLRAARQTLAQAAVVGERLRLDAELRLALGTDLARVTAACDRAGGLAAGADVVAAEAELRTVAAASRAALAHSRQLVRRYRQVSLRSELQTASTLLAAAGIQARIELPPGGQPGVISEELRCQLRSELARLLRENTRGECVITVALHDGQARLDLRRDAAAGRPGPVVSR
jgi:two-component system, NarL family, sensor histidine kinase DesK